MKMIRFIIERHKIDANSGLNRKDYSTFDISVPELEEILTRGGHGESGSESYRLIGVEVIQE